MFITELAAEGVRYSTIKSLLSAISYLHEFYECRNPTTTFMTGKLLLGIKRSQVGQPTKQCRPITVGLLDKLLRALPHVCDPRDIALYSSIFVVAYYGCMRLGELVLSTEVAHVALLEHLTLDWQDGLQPTFLLYLPSFKHSNGRRPTLRLHQHDKPACPVTWLATYLQQHGYGGHHLFLHLDGSPVTRRNVVDVLHRALTFLGMNAGEYGGHSSTRRPTPDFGQMGVKRL